LYCIVNRLDNDIQVIEQTRQRFLPVVHEVIWEECYYITRCRLGLRSAGVIGPKSDYPPNAIQI